MLKRRVVYKNHVNEGNTFISPSNNIFHMIRSHHSIADMILPEYWVSRYPARHSPCQQGKDADETSIQTHGLNIQEEND